MYCTRYQGTSLKSFTFHIYQYCNIHKTVSEQLDVIIKQYYCIEKRLKNLLLSKRNNLTELMLLLKISVSRLASKLYLISNTNLLFPFTKMLYY